MRSYHPRLVMTGREAIFEQILSLLAKMSDILSPVLTGKYASETYSRGSARRGRARAVPPLCTE